MQFLYACHLQLPDAASAPNTVRGLLGEWLSERFGIEAADWSQGAGVGSEAQAGWRTRTGTAGELLDLDVEHADRAAGQYRWSTQLWLGAEPSGAWLRIRVGVQALRDGVVVEPNLSIGRPGLVRSVVGSLAIQVDGFPVGSFLRITRTDVDGYVAYLLDPARRLPVVTVTKAAGAPLFVHPQRLADRLLGIAHVVAVDPDATFAVSERLGNERSVFAGAIRLYWPGFEVDAPLRSHPLWLPRSLEYHGREGFEQLLVGQIGRVAALSIAEPRLHTALRREEHQAEAAERARDLAERRERREAERSTGEVEALFDGLARDYDELQGKLTALEDENLRLLEELDDARAAQERTAAIAKQAFVVAASTTTAGIAPSADPPPAPPATVAEAVEKAAERCPHLVFLPEALRSAQESNFASPQTVLDDLLVAGEVARLWAADNLDGDFRAAFSSRTSNYRTGVSESALNQYPGDYTRDYDGRRVVLGPHLRRGVGAANDILGIYWYCDAERRVFVVGHVGRHLRDDSART